MVARWTTYAAHVRPMLVITHADTGGNDEAAADAALSVLRRAAAVEVHRTESPADLDAALRDAAGHLVVVFGGDGTLHAVVNALARAGTLDSCTLGLVPVGTGNDFARGAGIPLGAAEAAALVVSATPRPVDTIVADDGLVTVNSVHLGVGAQASRHAHAWKPRLGRLGYLVGALTAGLRPEFLRVEVRVDGRLLVGLDQRVAQVAVGNGATVGGGTPLMPRADPTDGRLDVLVSLSVSPTARLAYLATLRRARHHERHDVVYVRGSEVSVTGHAFWTSADGENSGPHEARSWRLHEAAFLMALP